MEQLLRLSRDTLAKDHPALDPALLDKALLLALGGRVGKLSQTEWLVKSQTNGETYQVSANNGWVCTCPMPAPTLDTETGIFGLPGRHCKHVVAVAICQAGQGMYLNPPASLWDLLERIVRSQVAPKAPVQGKLESLELPGTKARLVRPYRSDGREVLTLKVGHTMSGPLVEWKSIIDMRSGHKTGQWVLTTKARETYQKWVEELIK